MKNIILKLLIAIILLILIIAPAFAQDNNGVFIQSTAGILSPGKNSSGNVSVGYSFNRNSIGIFNQLGANYIKIAAVEYQRRVLLSDNYSVGLLVGVTPFNIYANPGQTGRNNTTAGKWSADAGIVVKRKIIGKLNAVLLFRGSAFPVKDQKKQKTRVISPVTITIGISKN